MMKLAISALAAAAALLAADGPKFEVASVKPAPTAFAPATGAPGVRGTGGGCPQSLKVDAARLDIQCANLTTLIGYAYRFPPDRIKGPQWMLALGSPKFNIAATLPQGASRRDVPEMLQDLLRRRFGLVLHRGTSVEQAYVLVVAKGGVKLQPALYDPDAAAPDDSPTDSGFYGATEIHRGDVTTVTGPRMGRVKWIEGPNRIQRLDADSISGPGIADLLDEVAPLPTPILDKTGLKGRYRLVLEVSLADLGAPQEMEASVIARFNSALRKLGLELQQRKEPVETLFVDRVEKTPSPN